VAIWVRGLPANADVGNTAVVIGGAEARVVAVVGGQVNCVVPRAVGSGEQAVRVRCGGMVSEAGRVLIEKAS
jgi:uncharacterized protein (TIGR03437 family)